MKKGIILAAVIGIVLLCLAAVPPYQRNLATTNLPAALPSAIFSSLNSSMWGRATNATHATNFWGLLSSTNLPAAYVAPEATHATNADLATSATTAMASTHSTNLWGLLSPTNLPGVTYYELTLITNGADTVTLHITNGLIMAITAP